MGIFQPLLELLLFLFAIFTCFYLPGKLLNLTLKFKLTFFEDIFFSTTIGFMLFTFVAYIFSWLHMEIVLLPLFLAASLFTLKKRKWIPQKMSVSDIKPLIFILVLSSIFSLTMITSGQFGPTLRLLGVNAGDGLWHLSLINELKAHFPPDNPTFAGVPLKGYHFFYNFLLAKLSNIFQLPPMALLFHFMPVVVAMLWGIGTYALMLRWSKNKLAGLWAVFLTMFGGSFAFILHLQGHTGLSLDSAFGIHQPTPALHNPPFAVSIVIVIASLFAIYNYLNTKQNTWLIPLTLCLGLVTMFKVYAGMVLLSGFLFLVLVELLRKRFVILLSLFAVGGLFLGTYWLFRDESSRLFFQPLWAPHHTLLDNLTWYGYGEKQYTYSKLNVTKGLIEIELYALFVFFIGSLGTRIVGLIFLLVDSLKKRYRPSLFALTLLSMTGVAILTPLFFIQSGKVFEIIQMSWYFLFFVSLFASLGFAAFFSLHFNKFVKGLLVSAIVLANLPSPYETLRNYAQFSGETFAREYVEAKFLQKEGNYDSTILEVPPQHVGESEADLKKWYRSTNPFLTSFANKKSFLHYPYIEFAGVDITPRILFLQKIILFEESNGKRQDLGQEIISGLKDYRISFIYSSRPLPDVKKLNGIRSVYQNKTATIYQFAELHE